MKRLLPILLLVFSVGVGAFDKDDLKQLKATNKCFKCDLSGANLSEANLSRAKLATANLDKANLTNARLIKAILMGAYLRGAILINADLTEAYLVGANLSGADLTEAYLVRARLKEAYLVGANLSGADLTGARFCKTRMPDNTINNSDCLPQFGSQKPLKKVTPPKPSLRKAPAPKSGSRKVAATGTGFFINSDGYIVTNSHVVTGCDSVVTVQDSNKIITKVIFDDSRNDLALLKVDKRPKGFATFRGGRSIRTAEDILALGYPFQSLLSDDLKITKGMVNSLAGLRNDTRMMQISAPVQPGNSGGPLLDHAGNVVGVVTSRMNAVKMAKHTGKIPQNVNFALKASLVRDMLDVKSIDYEMASSKKELKAVDIFDRAREYTVLVECLQ